MRCTAQLSNRTRRCRKSAILGSNVCERHGGAAPQVREAARRRVEEQLEALAGPAVAGLREALESGQVYAIIKAAATILDRTGFSAKSKLDIDVEHQPIPLDRLSPETVARICEELGIEFPEPEPVEPRALPDFAVRQLDAAGDEVEL